MRMFLHQFTQFGIFMHMYMLSAKVIRLDIECVSHALDYFAYMLQQLDADVWC